MSRKKNKQTRKYKPRNEFRVNNSPLAGGHPNYIFGETRNGKFKSLGLTTNPDAEHTHYKLSKNPDPNSSETSHLQTRVHTAKKRFYNEPLTNWSFSDDDMPVVRHTIKKYKKSTNRKSKKKPPKK